jgi:hypothetical protein
MSIDILLDLSNSILMLSFISNRYVQTADADAITWNKRSAKVMRRYILKHG